MDDDKKAVAFQIKHAADHKIMTEFAVRGLTISKVVRRLVRDFADNDYKFDYPDDDNLGAITREKTCVVMFSNPSDIEIYHRIKKDCYNISQTIRRLLRQFRDGGYEFKKKESESAI